MEDSFGVSIDMDLKLRASKLRRRPNEFYLSAAFINRQEGQFK